MAVDRRKVLGLGAVLAALGARLGFSGRARAAEGGFPVSLSDAEWRARLGARAYDVLRREATERPHSSPLNHEHRAGRFACAGCGRALFASGTKFDSGTGWPSFFRPLEGAVGEHRDWSLGIPRTEVHCAGCGGHLGHVFKDGPPPTGLRYCMNGVALRFEPGGALGETPAALHGAARRGTSPPCNATSAAAPASPTCPSAPRCAAPTAARWNARAWRRCTSRKS